MANIYMVFILRNRSISRSCRGNKRWPFSTRIWSVCRPPVSPHCQVTHHRLVGFEDTSANINDGRAGPDALPDDPGEVADSAYRGSHFRDAVLAKCGIPRIVATGTWGRDGQATLAKLKDWPQPIHRVRGRIEKIFGTWKRSYGLRRMPRAIRTEE